ncbi:ABC transporter ATP-binding protein [Mesonia sp. HuA40]|uniref:ABC transporter ATP-binding protein n=1 Tax=Mesonia sp. HuA40 TaxID=2602761 RepID=UPI0011C9970B|nr:ABC transporter ATP-binding protein [Mesonia sp. HuA40]TXK72688.1 ABC transporter ATP-binding protein [Mesonia sp. HuA40]
MEASKSLLKIKQLSLGFTTKKTSYTPILKNIDLEIGKNEIVGLVGESGSGKSILSLCILQLLSKQAKIKKGSIQFNNRELLDLPKKEFQNLRGVQIAMIFQEPMSSLNPAMRCGRQVVEILAQHTSLSFKQAQQKTLELFKQVKLPDVERVYRAYPHQISGGQKQRVMIAMAIACKPQLLIADEPTTALDVTVQNEILLLLKEIQKENQMSILFISHDLAVVSKIADRVAVMYRGKILEVNETQTLFKNPQNQYTRALLLSKPRTDVRLKRLPTVEDILQDQLNLAVETREDRQEKHKAIYAQAPLLEAKNLKKVFTTKTGLWGSKREFTAVDSVNFKIYAGETLGLVGESGCGKSTLADLILRLTPATSGQVYYKGKEIFSLPKKEQKKLRQKIQLIFQDPFSSLNPRLTIGRAIMEPMLVHGLYKNKAERKDRALYLLNRVGLDKKYFNRFPHEFSGGQRQRIGIARTIAVNPELIICDESVSALDISVQAQVLNLLNELKEDFGFTYLFISHDLSVVKYMADQLLVMNRGKIVERGDPDSIYKNPRKQYTQDLIKAMPI